MLISQLCAPEPSDSTPAAESGDPTSNIVVPQIKDYMLQRQNNSHCGSSTTKAILCQPYSPSLAGYTENSSRRNSLLNTGLSPVLHTTDADDVSSSGSLRTVVEEDAESIWSQSPPFERKGRGSGVFDRMPRRCSDVVTWGTGGCDTSSDSDGYFGRRRTCLSEGCDPNPPITPSDMEPPNSTRSSLPLKRSTNDSADEDDSRHEEGAGKKAKLSNGATSYVPEFACPFYKRNRHVYWQQRSCRTSGWPSVHRVKEHLYRHHMHSVCERCSSTFKSQSQLREHLRQVIPCQVSPRDVAEDAGFDQEVEKKLRSRKKIEGQTEEDKWAHVYRLLFPSFRDKPTPSPYVDYDPRDEPPVHPVMLQGYERPPVMHPAPTPRNAIAMVAAAAEQRIAATESTGNGSGLSSSGNYQATGHGSALPAATNGRLSMAEVAAVTTVDSATEIRRIIAEEVRAVISSLPSPTVPLSP